MTIRKHYIGTLALCGFSILVIGGCSGGDGYNGVKVTGSVVAKDGKPFDGVSVSFNSQDKDKGSKGVTTDSSGKFELKLKPGRYTVTLIKYVDKQGNVPKTSEESTEDYTQLLAAGKLKQVIPDKFVSSDTTPFNSVDIPAEGKALAPFEVK